MSASYPSSAKSFTTKLSGDTVQAAHVNDLQEEVRAVEVGLISGLQHHLLFTDNTYDIGASGATRPRNVYIAQGILAGGAVTVGAGLIVSGTSVIAGHLTFTDDTYDIGASGATRPRNLYLSQGAQLGGALTLGGAITLSAGQIAFPAAQNPSSNANTLDDYEEGTWTPVIGGSGGTSGQSYSAQLGRYVKIGKLVYVQGYALLSTKGTITTNVQVQGLPFAVENTANQFTAASIGQMNNTATSLVSVYGYASPGTTTINITGKTAAATSSTALTTADIGNTTDIVFTLMYRTDN